MFQTRTFMKGMSVYMSMNSYIFISVTLPTYSLLFTRTGPNSSTNRFFYQVFVGLYIPNHTPTPTYIHTHLFNRTTQKSQEAFVCLLPQPLAGKTSVPSSPGSGCGWAK